MKYFKYLRYLLIGCLFSTIFISCQQRTPADQELVFTNPLVLQRADPFVYKTPEGVYYLIATVPEYNRIELRSSNTINGLAEAEPVVVWSRPESGDMSGHIWAPELHRIDGTWYIYFAAGRADDEWRIRMWVLSNDSEIPTQGEWVARGQIQTERDAFALDATTFVYEGQRYLLWTENVGPEHNTGLLLAKMADPTTIVGPQVVITVPEYEWEIQRYRVNEAPAVIFRNNKIFVTYSASATDHNYAIGLLWAEMGSNLLDTASWNKSSEPIFFSNPEFNRFGPGHNSFTVAEDGVTDLIFYHARDYKEIVGHPLFDPNRHTRVRVLNWTEDGFPDFRQNYE